MAAEFESGMFVKTPAWHRLGTVIQDAPNTTEGIKLAGLDWKAELKELVTVEKAQTYVECVVDRQVKPNVEHKAVVRSTDGNVLGVVGPRYTPLQNSSAFKWFDSYIDAGLCQLESAGSLKGGKVVWVLAQIKRNDEFIVKNDPISKYFLISNSHDGTQAVRIGLSPIRVVCANTLALAHQTGSLIRIRHSAGVKQNLEAMKQIIDEVDMSFKATVEQYQNLVSRQINQTDLRQYVKVLLKVDHIPDTEMSTRMTNIMDTILGKMDEPEQQITGISGTWYTAYQSYNSWLCHNHGRNEDNRLHNIWFGQNATKNNTALETALEMAG